ncbi:nicotinate phosphoribosyltransferase [Bryobacterales bacterium F-183]|nr:nicotinate phosphoribosyltransferase [Bryobacterales bacterium F-183]
MRQTNLGLVTDLYQLTMAAGYLATGKQHETATFELFFRKLPKYRHFVVACGLQQAVEYLLNLRFDGNEIDYLRALPVFSHVDPGFFEMLREFRFTGDVFSVREGTPVFAGEPFLTVHAPLIEAQIPETYLLATVAFQSMIATKAARVAEAAAGRACFEFGSRRAHSPEAGVLAARAAYIGGCAGTSNVEAGYRYGIPVFGTGAHSWVLSFESETEAFRAQQKLLGENTTYLIDSYDTLEGARKAIALGGPMSGVRLDSGNLTELAPAVRQMLDKAGYVNARIMASGELNEYKILELVAGGVPIDAFGVGTDLSTSSDSPTLGAVYKMVELESAGKVRMTAKFSGGKATLPGAKQVFRYPDHDLVGLAHECFNDAQEALLRPVVLNGNLVEPLPSAAEARDYAAAAIRALPAPCRTVFEREAVWQVKYSRELLAAFEDVKAARGQR